MMLEYNGSPEPLYFSKMKPHSLQPLNDSMMKNLSIRPFNGDICSISNSLFEHIFMENFNGN